MLFDSNMIIVIFMQLACQKFLLLTFIIKPYRNLQRLNLIFNLYILYSIVLVSKTKDKSSYVIVIK